MKTFLHSVGYFFWISKEIIVAGVSTAFAAFKPNAGIEPVVIYYPLRLTSDWELFWFSTSITATPSTLSMGFREPACEGDPRILLVQAAFGTDPANVISDLVDMEEHVNPAIKDNPIDPAEVAWEPYVDHLKGDLS